MAAVFVKWLQYAEFDGLVYRPEQVATMEEADAQRLSRGGYVLLVGDEVTGPDQPDPLPQYITESELLPVLDPQVALLIAQDDSNVHTVLVTLLNVLHYLTQDQYTARLDADLAARIANSESLTNAATRALIVAGVGAPVAVLVANLVPPQVAAALAADGTVAAAAAAAVTANIAGRQLLEYRTYDEEVTPLSFAMVDTNGRQLWLEADLAGNPTPRVIAKLMSAGLQGLAQIGADQAPELAFGVVDQNGRRTDLEVGLDGHFTPRVIELLQGRLNVQARNIYPTALRWAHWGDSLTGAGSNGGWVDKIAVLTGHTHYNGGVGGQGVTSIAARQGGAPGLVAPFNAPTNGAVAVSLPQASPLSNGMQLSGVMSDSSGASLAGVLASDGSGNHTFTRNTAGTIVSLVGRVMFVPIDALARRSDYATLWAGRNDFLYRPPALVVQRVQNMLDYLLPEVPMVMVLEVPPAAAETIGTASRVKLDAGNAALRAAFPAYFLDVCTYLRTDAAFAAAGVAKTAQDQTDINNGVTPTSFTSDGLHFSDNGGKAIAAYVYSEAKTRGWVI